MSDDIVNLEVDGKPVEGRRGQMIIEVTDEVGAYVPRFCYHGKLSVAANCRMCLVEVEKAPKPIPACATPIGEGMKVFTKSAKAIAAQKATMEFLQLTLAALVTDRAIQRVVDQQEFHHRTLRLFGVVGTGADFHAVHYRRGAGG